MLHLDLNIRWTGAEEQILLSAVRKRLHDPELWKFLPQRTIDAIIAKCKKLQLDVSYGLSNTYVRGRP